jgi:chromosome partitioning protein
MIISLVSLKGGAGKTTLSINLAVAYAQTGAKVTLIDSDPNNQNALKWSGIRPQDKAQIVTVSLSDADALRNNINPINASCDIVIIDGTPALAELTGTIMLVSDLVLLPIRSSTFDYWAFNEQFLPTLKNVRSLKEIDCRIVLNAVRKRSVIGREVLDALEQYDIPIMNRKIGLRTVFENSPKYGLGVGECDDNEAKFEIKMLQKAVHEILTTKIVTA